MAPRSVRFSPETEAALVAKAAELDRPVSWVVQRAVESFLSSPSQESVAEALRPFVGNRWGAAEDAAAALAGKPAVMCPRCDWVSGDRDAKCPTHGRGKLIR